MRARNRARIAVAAIAVVLLVAGGFSVAAVAAPGPNLDTSPETQSQTIGGTVTLTATISTSIGITGTPVNIDFEVETGPDNGDGNTPTAPDRTCTVTGSLLGNSTCTVTWTSAHVGTNTIRSWVDNDGQDATTEDDNNEGVDETALPGNVPEPDNTDVVAVTWVFPPPGPPALMDCYDRSGNAPGADTDHQTDFATGAIANEPYTCTVTDAAGTPISGIAIDGENLDGANDPNSQTGPDYNNFCTTTAPTGSCTGTVPAHGVVGTAKVCFWADVDADSEYRPTGDVVDGGDCPAEAAQTTPSGDEASNNDLTDVVYINWIPRPPSRLDCNDASGDDHAALAPQPPPPPPPADPPPPTTITYTCAVRDTFGDTKAGITIDGENLGPDNVQNDKDPGADFDNFCVTDSAGTCQGTLSFAAPTPPGHTTICFWTDLNHNATYDPGTTEPPRTGDESDGGDCPSETVDETEGLDLTDAVAITWISDTIAPKTKITRPVNNGTYLQTSLQQFKGTASDSGSGVGRIQISLRKYLTNGTCQLWTGTGFVAATNCKTRRFIDAVIGSTNADGSVNWTYNLPAPLPKSQNTSIKNYVVLARSWDFQNNIEVVYTTGINRNYFEIV